MRFVVLANQYGGITEFSKYLENHPEIDYRGEVFYKKDVDRKDHDFLDDIFKSSKKEATGFTVMYNQLRKWMLYYFKGNDVKVVQLIGRSLEQGGEIDETFINDVGNWEQLYKPEADCMIAYKTMEPSKDKKWRNIKVRKSFLEDFLGVSDKVLSL